MGRRINSWIALFQSLRGAFVEVLRAEVSSFRLDLELSRRHLVRTFGFAALTVFVTFWALGVVVFLLIQVADLWLPVWAATLVVLAILVLVGLVFAASARHSLRQIEEPRTLIRRHVQEHVDWWEQQILPNSDYLEEVPQPAGESSAEGTQEST